MNPFAYTDENDRSYGLTGMVVSLTLYDKTDMLHCVTLDADNGEYIMFTPDFFFTSNPRYSAKLTWTEMVRQYQVLMGMLMGNVMCRTMVKDGNRLTRQMTADLYDLVEEEGRVECSLDRDEITNLFSRTLDYLDTVYSNARIRQVVDQFASTLRDRRSLSRAEVEDEIAPLRHI